jgi:tetratricopeptide (TPR) repeat protein
MRRTLRHAAILLALTLAWPAAGTDGTKPLPPPSDQFATYHNRGASLVDQGRFDEALDYLDAAVKMRPQSVLALYNRGRLHYLSGATNSPSPITMPHSPSARFSACCE